MELEVLRDGPRAVFAGELTIYTAAGALEAVRAIAADGGPMELDLERVTELDTAGYQLLHQLLRVARLEARPLSIVAASEAVRAVLALLHVERHYALAPRPAGLAA